MIQPDYAELPGIVDPDPSVRAEPEPERKPLPPLRGHPPGYKVTTYLRGVPNSPEPLSRKYYITHDLVRPADQPDTWYVRGACSSPAFDTLLRANLFMWREIQKYRNGSIRPFIPTHVILWQPPQAPAIRLRMPVTMIDLRQKRSDAFAGLYREEWWRACTIAEWTYNFANSRLYLDDIMIGTSWQLRTVDEAKDLETLW